MAIHGIKPNGEDEEKPEAVKFDENQIEALRIAREKAMERKKLEFLNKGKNG